MSKFNHVCSQLQIAIILVITILSLSNTYQVNVSAQPVCCPNGNQCGALLGVYYGNQGFNMSQVVNLETWQNKKNAVVTIFTNMDPANTNQLFQTQLPNIWNNGNVPVITWEPFLAGSTPNDIETQIANGSFDSYFNTWTTQLQNYIKGPDNVLGSSDDRRAYIRLGHEMNGNYYPWSAEQGQNTPQDYINMWRKVYGIVNQNVSKDQLQWIWSVNNVDIGSFTAQQYYPGDDYVDWLGIDGYNFGLSGGAMQWQTPQTVFGDMISRLRAISSTKPLAINEIGSTTNNLGSAAKDTWISDAYDYLDSQNIKMISWFNEDKETDLAIYAGSSGTETGATNAYTRYKAKISQLNLIPSDNTNSRLLTTSQFQGSIPNSQISCVLPTNSPPTISIVSPQNNQSFNTNTQLVINLTAADSDGSVTQVAIFDGPNLLGNAVRQGTTYTYILTIPPNSFAAGNHTITARATDNQSAQTTSSPVNFQMQLLNCANGATNYTACDICPNGLVIKNSICVTTTPTNQLPDISFASPDRIDFDARSQIRLTGNVSDSDGTISQVAIFDNGHFVGYALVLNSSWSFTYSGTLVGSHILKAVAVDNQNGSTESNSQTIHILNLVVAQNTLLIRTGGQNSDYSKLIYLGLIFASGLSYIFYRKHLRRSPRR